MEEFEDQIRRGERPDVATFSERFPHLATEIEAVFPMLLLLEDFGSIDSPAPITTNVTIPREVGDFIILRQAGQGGMGVVYEAIQRSLGRRVALKMIGKNLVNQSNFIERFQREAQIAARLHHTNIVPVYSVGQHNDYFYYVMQFIRGQSLAAVIAELKGDGKPVATDLETTILVQQAGEGSTLPDSLRSSSHGSHANGKSAQYFANIAHLVTQIARGLDYAHDCGVVHRDIKPSNIILDYRGIPWITDFGLAKASGSDALTNPGDAIGTIAYMAPEQFDGQAGPGADIYGLGLIVYELATLQPAFQDELKVRLIEKIRHTEPTPPRIIDRSIPKDLETIILKAIAKTPPLRYQRAGELADDLQRFLEGRTIHAKRANLVQQLHRWCLRNRVVAALLLIVFSLLLALLAGATVSLSTLRANNTQITEQSSQLQQSLNRTNDLNNSLRKSLRTNLLLVAKLEAESKFPGHRNNALSNIQQAAEIEPGSDLRNIAIEVMQQSDLQKELEWTLGPTVDEIALDREFNYYTRSYLNRTYVDSAILSKRNLLTLDGKIAMNARFHPTSSLVGFGFHAKTAGFELWDYLNKKNVLKIANSELGATGFDFSADGNWAVLVHGNGTYQVISMTAPYTSSGVKTFQLDGTIRLTEKLTPEVLINQASDSFLINGFSINDSPVILYGSFREPGGLAWLQPSSRVHTCIWAKNGKAFYYALQNRLYYHELKVRSKPIELGVLANLPTRLILSHDEKYLFVNYAKPNDAEIWNLLTRSKELIYSGALLKLSDDQRVGWQEFNKMAGGVISPNSKGVLGRFQSSDQATLLFPFGTQRQQLVFLEKYPLYLHHSEGTIQLRKVEDNFELPDCRIPASKMLWDEKHNNLFSFDADGITQWHFSLKNNEKSTLLIQKIARLTFPGYSPNLTFGVRPNGNLWYANDSHVMEVARTGQTVELYARPDFNPKKPPVKPSLNPNLVFGTSTIFSNDGKWLIKPYGGALTSNSANVHHLENNEKYLIKDYSLRRLTISNSQPNYIITHHVGKIQFTPLDNPKQPSVWEVPTELEHGPACLTADGQQMALVASSEIKIFDFTRREELVRLPAYSNAHRIVSLQFTSDKQKLLISYEGGAVLLWHLDRLNDSLAPMKLNWYPTAQSHSTVRNEILQVLIQE
ncbi:MAG: serine/threonine-protein kinase [Zavarzinella sp.]